MLCGAVQASAASSDLWDRPRFQEALVLLVSSAIFLGCVISPPSLMDDVDAVNATVARNMLESGDWVTGRLDGVLYVDKAPLHYWLMALCYAVFGVSDWAARMPMALASVFLCWVTYRFGRWAFSPRAGFFAGLSLATSVGLFLFTRVRIPDVALTLAVTTALWAFARAVDSEERHSLQWSLVLGASLAAGVLLKGLVALILPCAVGLLYLLASGQLFSRPAWRRVHLAPAACLFLLLAAPWHVLATLENPPYFDFTLSSGPGRYRGFLWRYFINEHWLRYLGARYPRDYNTVPLVQFWLLHVVWLFPWSAFLPAAVRLSYRPTDRAGRVRLLALCWIAFILLFFSFSTSQEYYTMPSYPAFALLIGSAIAQGGRWVTTGAKAISLIAALAVLGTVVVLYSVRDVLTPGDISSALTQNPEAYTLSMGHMRDLTLEAFAYLRLPLVLAAVSFALGAVGSWRSDERLRFASVAVMMVLLAQAARVALITFDPYLSSRPLAEELSKAPEGTLIADDQYYSFSSIFFYADRGGLLLNGRKNNLEYGSNAPGAPDVFIDDADFRVRWLSGHRHYLATFADQLPRLQRLVGADHFYVLVESGGKLLLTNHAPPENSMSRARS